MYGNWNVITPAQPDATTTDLVAHQYHGSHAIDEDPADIFPQLLPKRAEVIA